MNAVMPQGNSAAHYLAPYSALSSRLIVILIAPVKSYLKSDY